MKFKNTYVDEHITKIIKPRGGGGSGQQQRIESEFHKVKKIVMGSR